MDSKVQRKKIRLDRFDYSSKGSYFVTICTKDKICLLSSIIPPVDQCCAPVVQLSKYGEVVEKNIKLIPGIDSFVIMPNHVHMIISKENNHNTDLSNDIRTFKSMVTKNSGQPIWQKYFYDHIIRDANDYMIKAKYIENNPAKWADDDMYIPK